MAKCLALHNNADIIFTIMKTLVVMLLILHMNIYSNTVQFHSIF